MNDGEAVGFEHVVIDSDGPRDPHIKAVGDVDGDGVPEIVVASSAGGPLVWYEFPGWTKHVISPSGGWSTDAKLVDMDGDGDLDVVISEWYRKDRMEWYENPLPDGDPASDPWKLHVIGSPRAHDFQVGDIDGDGQLEIVGRQQGEAGNEIVIWKRTGPDAWAKRTVGCPRGEGLALGDLDGDGMPEIVIGGRFYKPSGDVLRDEWNEHVFADWAPDAMVEPVDMNGNGHLDVVLARSEGPYKLSWFEAPPDPVAGKWAEHVVEDDIEFAHSLAVADMNGNGLLDIVTAEMHQSPRKRVMVYFNGGDALEWRRQIIATTGSHNLCVADIGNTGKMDIIGANWSGDSQPVEIWRRIQ